VAIFDIYLIFNSLKSKIFSYTKINIVDNKLLLYEYFIGLYIKNDIRYLSEHFGSFFVFKMVIFYTKIKNIFFRNNGTAYE